MPMGVLLHAVIPGGTRLNWWYPEVWAVVLGFCTIYFYLVGPYREKHNLADGLERRYLINFIVAMALLLLSEGTAMHHVAEKFLFSVHMIQHVLLAMIFAPVFIASVPTWLYSHFLQIDWVYKTMRVITNPAVALLVYNGVNAAWHLAGFYELVLYHHWVHIAQHMILVFTALMMWWPIVSPARELPMIPYGAQLLYIFLLLLVQLPLAGPIIFAEETFYGFYVAAPRVSDMTPLEDQQLAGMVMLSGGMAIMIAFLFRAFFRWVASEDSGTPQTRLGEEAGQRQAGT